MNSEPRKYSYRSPWIAAIFLALLLPSGLSATEECASLDQPEPLTLLGQRIPTYEVFETFLLHASVVYETRGATGFRAFLTDFGLDPDLDLLQSLPWAFHDMEMEAALQSDKSRTAHRKAEQVGEMYADLLAEIRNQPTGKDAEGQFRLELLAQLRSEMSWVFIDSVPDFLAIDEAEARFNEALGGPPATPDTVERSGAEENCEAHTHSGTQVKMSFLDRGLTKPWTLPAKHLSSDSAEFAWRRYSRADGSVRIVGLIDSGSEALTLVDLTFPAGEELRTEFRQQGLAGLLEFTEYFQLEPDLFKSHTTLGCATASAAAVLACAACVVDPSHLSCGACAVATAAAADACNNPHCNQIECNGACVTACHLYGECTSTGGSSTPQDCQCVGQRFDIPGCYPPDPPGPHCDDITTQLGILELGNTEATTIPTEAFTLDRLEKSKAMHHGEEVSYLMGEWAVLAYDSPSVLAKSSDAFRMLRSSSPEFSRARMAKLLGSLAGTDLSFSRQDEKIAIIVAIPPHETNSRQIPMPALKIATADGVPGDLPRGKIAIRADFAENGEMQDLEILFNTVGGVSPHVTAQIRKALSLQRFSAGEHRVVSFAILDVDETVEIQSSLSYLPKCCCGDSFCN